MDNINFVSGGLLGDFLQQLYTVKNICEQREVKANLYIADGYGDKWTFGVETAYRDLAELIYSQNYINSFQILTKPVDESFINLSSWREAAATDFATTGEYNTCWSELLSKQFNFHIPTSYRWITAPATNEEVKGRILIHRSTHRHGGLPWKELLSKLNEEVLFLTCNPAEINAFKSSWFFENFDTNKIKLYLVNNIYEMAIALNSCRYFIGNQSAPFSLASALDVPRMVELESGVWKFYKDEIKYSKNISWHLSEKEKYLANNSIIKL